MPGADFFGRIGLFVIKRFFDDEFCALLRSEMDVVPTDKARTISRVESILDESIRRTHVADVSKATLSQVVSQLRKLKPRLEEHFSLQLDDCECPQFLAYDEGCFFRAHSDGSSHPDALQLLKCRRISVVVFLNAESQSCAEGCYGGGRLTLYGLLNGGNWKNCPLPVKAEAGLLVAFRSDLMHEVTPITFGRRYTIVSWFFSESDEGLPTKTSNPTCTSSGTAAESSKES